MLPLGSRSCPHCPVSQDTCSEISQLELSSDDKYDDLELFANDYLGIQSLFRVQVCSGNSLF